MLMISYCTIQNEYSYNDIKNLEGLIWYVYKFAMQMASQFVKFRVFFKYHAAKCAKYLFHIPLTQLRR